MSTKTTLEISSASSEETVRLGRVLGGRLKGGEVIELVSDLGGGKTTFTRGIAEGIGSTDHVSSPTFKVCNVYKGASLELYHYDFYRLPEAGLIEHELGEIIEDDNIVIVVEWGALVDHVLPEQRITVKITSESEDGRKIHISGSSSMAYLLNDLT